jgi:hypothetical protein
MVAAPAKSARRPLLLLAAVSAAACFRLVGPEEPEPVTSPQLVPVSIEYRQPVGCNAPDLLCGGPVIFFASWTREGGEFALERIGDTNIWRGVAQSVPVNYPPRDDPYRVRVFDPFLLQDDLEGVTANRLRVGGELLTRLSDVGDEDESALVYIDEDGRGHNAP